MGLGLGLGLENKERSKEDLRHYYAFDGKLGHHSVPHTASLASSIGTLLSQHVRTYTWKCLYAGLKPQLVHVIAVSISGTLLTLMLLHACVRVCVCVQQHVMIIIAY